MKTKFANFAQMTLVSLMLVSNVCHSATTTDLTPQISEKYRPIPGMFEQDVILLTGINFKTGKPVIVDAMTGQIVQPCVPTPPPTNNTPSIPIGGGGGGITPGNIGRVLAAVSKPCIASVSSASPEVLSAIDSSERIYDGAMRKNGKDVAARFAISVTALYKGSDCVSYISGGNEYEVCSTLQNDCKALLPLSVYGYLPESNRRGVRNTCRQFPSIWRNPDCTNLKPVYRNPAMPYNLNYERYIYDSCKYQGGWGTRP